MVLVCVLVCVYLGLSCLGVCVDRMVGGGSLDGVVRGGGGGSE